MTTPPPPSQDPSGWKPGFKRRLGYYVFGLAIGTVMAVLMWQLRMMAARSGSGGEATPTARP